MNKEIEEMLVHTFVLKEKRDRALYMLSSNKRWNLIHNMENVSNWFNKKYLVKILEPISSYNTVLGIIKKGGGSNRCYVIIPDNPLIDGTEMPLETALKYVVGLGPAIISCDHGKLAYFECEQSFGAPNRYILLTN